MIDATSKSPPTDPSALRQPAFWLGLAELLLGVALGYTGCRHGWAADDSLSNFAGTVFILTAIVALLFPGACLMTRSRWRWLPQILPIALATWYAVVTLRR